MATICSACHRSSISEGTLARPAGADTVSKPELASGSIRFAVIGDYGTGESDELEVARMVASWKPSFIITVGDNDYPNGEAADFEPHIAAAYAAFIPGDHGGYGSGGEVSRFFPTLGNHDWRSSLGLDPYIRFFRTPGNGRYYEQLLADGRAELFALDSDPHEPDGRTADSKQAQWFKERIAASSACLKLVSFHHPPYSSSAHGSEPAMQWPFQALGADAVLTGHDHVYERLQIDGIPYFVDGLGGAAIYPFRTALPQSRVRYNEKHGALLITLSPEQTTYEFWSVAGERIDALSVANRCLAEAQPPAPTPPPILPLAPPAPAAH